MRVTAFVLVTLTVGCHSFESFGLGEANNLVDAAEPDVIAAVDTAEVDTASIDVSDAAEDTVVEDSALDAATDVVDAPPPFCDASDPDLLACYRFEVDAFPVQPHDESMYGHHGTATSVTYVDGPPGAGKALSMGASSVTNVPDKPTLAVTSALTIEAWVFARTLPTTTRAGIVDVDGRYGLFIHSGGVLRATAPGNFDTPTKVITAGKWVHVAYTYDGKVQRLYVAGSRVAERALSGLPYGPGGGGLAVGMNSPDGDRLEGAVDSVRIFRVARTAAQICAAAGAC